MSIKRLVSGTCLLATLIASSQALATMSLDRMIVYFKPNQLPRQDVVVSNPDKENLYLQTEVYNVVNPGTQQEERIRVTDPKDIKLLATPGKAIIPPNFKIGSAKTVDTEGLLLIDITASGIMNGHIFQARNLNHRLQLNRNSNSTSTVS